MDFLLDALVKLELDALSIAGFLGIAKWGLKRSVEDVQKDLRDKTGASDLLYHFGDKEQKFAIDLPFGARKGNQTFSLQLHYAFDGHEDAESLRLFRFVFLHNDKRAVTDVESARNLRFLEKYLNDFGLSQKQTQKQTGPANYKQGRQIPPPRKVTNDQYKMNQNIKGKARGMRR